MLGATGFLAETANNFPSTLTKVCPHCSRSDGSKSEMRHYTGIPHLCPHYRQGQHGLFQMEQEPLWLCSRGGISILPSHTFFWKMRWGEIYSMYREIWRGNVRCPRLCHGQCTEYSSTAPLERTLEWEELRKKSQVNFKSRITDFGFYNRTVDAHFFLHKPLFIFFYTKHHVLATCQL